MAHKIVGKCFAKCGAKETCACLYKTSSIECGNNICMYVLFTIINVSFLNMAAPVSLTRAINFLLSHIMATTSKINARACTILNHMPNNPKKNLPKLIINCLHPHT